MIYVAYTLTLVGALRVLWKDNFFRAFTVYHVYRDDTAKRFLQKKSVHVINDNVQYKGYVNIK